jgi:hypothetical protein
MNPKKSQNPKDMILLLKSLIINSATVFCSSKFQSKCKAPLLLKPSSIRIPYNNLKFIKVMNAIFISRNIIKKLTLPTTVNLMV